MTILRGTLSALSAVFVGLLGPGLFFALRGINNSKATGLAAVAGGLLESLFSPLFWILAVSFFALFFAASRLNSKPLRILLFWTPVLLFRYWDWASSPYLHLYGYISDEGDWKIRREPSLNDFECNQDRTRAGDRCDGKATADTAGFLIWQRSGNKSNECRGIPCR